MGTRFFRLAFFTVVFLAAILFAGCLQPEASGGGEQVSCDKPYIKVGLECCLDADDNRICDRDETAGGADLPVSTSESGVVCNSPYIRVGSECCLDQNFNSICDDDETGAGETVAPEISTTTQPTASSTSSTFQSTSTTTEEHPAPTCEEVTCDPGYHCVDGSCEENLEFTFIPMLEAELFQFCGDDICGVGEDSMSCCSDCGCPQGEYCGNNTCTEGTAPLVFAPLMMEVAPFFPSKETLISKEDGGSVSPPRIYGNKVVFHQYISASPQIFMYDTLTKTLSEIPHDGRAFYPDVTGGKMVWEDSSRPFVETTDTYYYNFAEGVEGIISPRNGYQRTPRIYNNLVVWNEWDDGVGGNVIYMYWIPSGEERRIFSPTGNKFFNEYDLWGGSIIYTTTDCTGGVPCTDAIYRYDVAVKSTSKILSSKTESIHSPGIWGDKISYIAGVEGREQVFVYDIKTKLTRKITSVDSEKRWTAVYGNKVVWSDKRNGNYDVYLYDLGTGEETQITTDESDDYQADIYGDVIVFIQGSVKGASPRDIYLYTLS